MSQTPTLTGAGIILRPLVSADAPALFIALRDPEVQRYRRGDVHAHAADTLDYIADTLARSRAAWAITEDGGEALGRLALRTPEDHIGEFGIVIRRDAQRRGLGAKALALAETYAFTTLGLIRLIADIDAENEASLALFSKAGFVRSAFQPGARRTKLGLRDSIVMERRRLQS